MTRRLLWPIIVAIGVVAAPWSVPALTQTALAPWTPPRTADGQPDLQGYWTNQGSVSTVNLEGLQRGSNDSPIIDPPDKKLPYQPWALSQRNKHTANHLDPKTFDQLDAESRCLPIGVPRINYATPYNGYQFLQKPGYVVLFAEWNHITRIIPLDGRPHVNQNIRLWMGDSRGRWEGNTLVVDVTNFTDETWLDEVGNFHSADLHVIERYTIVDANTIQYEATIDDPKVFTRPWKLGFAFTRGTAGDGSKLLAAGQLETADADQSRSIIFFKDSPNPNYQLYEYACHEGNLAIGNIFGAAVYNKLMRMGSAPPSGPTAR